jgi:phage gp45-like
VIAALQHLLAPIHRRVINMIARGIVDLDDDLPATRRLQVKALKGEVRTQIEAWEAYGFASRAAIGADALLLFVGGAREHGIALVADRRVRLKGLAPGEVAVYNPHAGTTILMRADGTVVITAARVTVSGDLVVSGAISDHRGSLDQVRDLYDVHTHTDPQGGQSGPPAPQMP